MPRPILKFFLISTLVIVLLTTAVMGVAALYFYNRFTRDLPKIATLNDYRPKAVTRILSDDGTLIDEIWEERRYPVRLEEIPPLVRRAFLASEDANFYQHPGISFTGVLRAFMRNLKDDGKKQGGSTITQQVVKSLLLTRERTYERKAKEAILSYRLEKALSKDEILTIYLNEIFLGQNAYGVKAASRVHFRKEMSELSISEAAFLAALPPSPSRYTDPEHREEGLQAHKRVLDRMLKNRFITQQELEVAQKEKLNIFLPTVKRDPDLSYFSDYAIQQMDPVLEQYSREKNLERTWTVRDPGGFDVYTTASIPWIKYGVWAVQKGLREIDKRRGWRGPLHTAKSSPPNIAESHPETLESLRSFTIYPAKIVDLNLATGVAQVEVGKFKGYVELRKATWAQKLIDKKDDSIQVDVPKQLTKGDVIEVSIDDTTPVDPKTKTTPPAPTGRPKTIVINDESIKIKFRLDQTPLVEGAFAVQNVQTGVLNVIVGGYDYRRSQFNRATDGMRQPGSSFKPFIYLGAVDALNYTPTTIVPDSPISLKAGNGQWWTPGNFDGKFLGPITLRTALQRSRNVVSVYLLQRLGVDRGIEYARKLGISTPIAREMSISLGTAETTLTQLIRAYSVFATNGYLAEQRVASKINDRTGELLVEFRPEQREVISQESAFLMANMMKGVVERGTATVLRALKKPVAGKTGTTNEHMDAWFVGYTPEWSAGVWIGFDQKKMIGKMETGGKAAAPIFLDFMQAFLKNTPPLDFEIPDGVVPVAIDLNSGHPVEPDTPGAFIEYFKSGTESLSGGATEVPPDYIKSNDF